MTQIPHSAREVLGLRDFRLFAWATFMTAGLQQMQALAVGWDLYERTGSVMTLAWIGVAQFLPVLLLFLPAGQIADRFDRRLVMVASQATFAVGSIGLSVSALMHADPLWIFGFLFVTGIGQVLNRPSRDALLPMIVPTPLIPNALALNSSLFQVSSIGGPALAGVLIASAGSAAGVYFINLALSLITMALALAIRVRPAAISTRPPLTLNAMLAGVRHVIKTRLILGVLIVDLFAVMFGGVSALLPVFAKDILHVGPVGLGWLASAQAIGALIMGVTQGVRKPTRHAGNTFVLAVAVYGLAMAAFGLSEIFIVSFLALMLAGAMDNLSVVLRHSVVQIYTPDELRGRVSAVNRVFVDSSNHVGTIETSLLAGLTSPGFCAVAGGLITIAVALVARQRFHELRELKTLSRS
ncbi:MAG: MFS transporter [Betaproteobacteria bacterium]|nr:MFS transporter [Betaproteobacteria bacterium]